MENPKQKEERQRRDKEILKLYPDLTLMEIGKRYNLTHERIRQILVKLKVEQEDGKVKIKKPQ